MNMNQYISNLYSQIKCDGDIVMCFVQNTFVFYYLCYESILFFT